MQNLASGLLIALLLTGCISAASALPDRIAMAPSGTRLALLKQECTRVAGTDRRAAEMIDACVKMEAALRGAPQKFAPSYDACVNASKRDGRLFPNRWNRVNPQLYRESRAVCDAYQNLFLAGGVRSAP